MATEEELWTPPAVLTASSEVASAEQQAASPEAPSAPAGASASTEALGAAPGTRLAKRKKLVAASTSA